MPTVFNSKNSKIGTKFVESKKTEKSEHGEIRDKILSKSLEEIRPEERHKLENHTHNPLTSYCFYPDYVQFVNRDPEEKVVLLLRKHPIKNLRWILLAFVMIIGFPFAVAITPLEFLPGTYQFILSLMWYLFVFAIIIEGFLSWFFHVNIITDERIIEVDFVNLIYREITDANIEDIQDVTVKVGGALSTFFDYGNVYIQTASEIPRINFESVPMPDKVARILRELRVEEDVEKLEGRIR